MPDQTPQIQELQDQMQRLLKRQAEFQHEIELLRRSIERLQANNQPQAAKVMPPPPRVMPKKSDFEPAVFTKNTTANTPLEEAPSAPLVRQFSLEKFIGENLMNKVGIIITVIGIAIGVKYAIEHDWLSPLTRIIMGYLSGFALLAVAIRLKPNYHSFSAVLLGGAMTTLYFTTYGAHAFYQLLPALPVFIIMVAITAITVYAALHYQQQIIALLGLVGAYAIPFLLGESSSPVTFFFAYLGLLNIGILLIALRHYWRLVHLAAFWLTWLIFFTWYWMDYQPSQHIPQAMFFASLYFGLFYAAFLVYKIRQAEPFKRTDLILLSANVFIYYGLGYALLLDTGVGTWLLGLYTLAMATLHFLVSRLILRHPATDRSIYLFILGLALVFVTIAVPVQLDGSWVTLLWTFGAVLMALVGNYTEASIYKKLSLPLMVLAFMSLGMDWFFYYDFELNGLSEQYFPFLNICFMTGILFSAAMGLITFVNLKVGAKEQQFKGLSLLLPPLLLLVSAYLVPYLEIAAYWDQFLNNTPEDTWYVALGLKNTWLLNYSLVFIIALGWINLRAVKSDYLTAAFLLFSVTTTLVFLRSTLQNFGLFRFAQFSEVSAGGLAQLGIRYLTYLLMGTLLWTVYQYTRRAYPGKVLLPIFDLSAFFLLLWIISFEWMLWTSTDQSFQSSRLGLSILWGLFAAVMIAIGIGQRKSYLRIGALVLFTFTLIKLFFYDLVQLDTLAKTIVLVALGVLLLGVSFLYNKYRQALFGEEA